MTEEEQINIALEGIKKPPFVENWSIHLDADSSGDPSVWIWVVISDELLNSSSLKEESDKLNEEIGAALRKNGIQRWPYVRFRAKSEQAQAR